MQLSSNKTLFFSQYTEGTQNYADGKYQSSKGC